MSDDHSRADQAAATAEASDDLPEQLRIRREKYDRLMAVDTGAPFPVGVARTHALAEVRTAYAELAAGASQPARTGAAYASFADVTASIAGISHDGRNWPFMSGPSSHGAGV